MATKQKKSAGAGSAKASRAREETASGQPEWRVQGNEVSSGAGQSLWESLPSGPTLVYFGALGLVGALGVIEWPVVAAIGVGTAVAQRAASAGSSESGGRGGSAARESKGR